MPLYRVFIAAAPDYIKDEGDVMDFRDDEAANDYVDDMSPIGDCWWEREDETAAKEGG